MTPELMDQFNAWVDGIVSGVGSTPVVAYNFNIYEHDNGFAVQIVGTNSFDLTDEDWACDEAFSSGEDLFDLPRSVFGTEWQGGLDAANLLVKNYLQHGKQAEVMKAACGVGVGFVDGNIELVYLRPADNSRTSDFPENNDH